MAKPLSHEPAFRGTERYPVKNATVTGSDATATSKRSAAGSTDIISTPLADGGAASTNDAKV